MKAKMLIVIMVMSVLIVACTDKDVHNDSTVVETNEDLKELINDYSIGNISDEAASITAKELIITDDNNKETVYNLPEEEFFVSIAPFINETHPCTIHSLTGCQGELVDTDFDFHVEDSDGNVVLNETLNSEANGFIDLWLPRNQTYLVKVTYEGKEVESEISTFENDGTCITTMQLM